MGKPSNHPSSIVLDHCWICSAKFTGNGGSAVREDHHVVPRAFGGVDGPTVTLCENHHGKLHRIAVALKAGKPYFENLQHEDIYKVKKLLYLANQVYNAELVMRNDPNKAASVMMTLNARHRGMVDSVKKIYPQAKSREAVFLLALEALYSKHFIQ